MVKTGDVIENPISGEIFRFLKIAADTNGELLQIECRVRPKGRLAAPIAHCHPKQEERFILQAGQVRVKIEGQERIYSAGETAIIPAGKFHEWNNPSATEEAVFICELRPALEWEKAFESIFALARAGKTNAEGTPNFLQIAVAFHHYHDHFYIQGIPIIVQKMVFALLSPVGKLLGYRTYYPYQKT